MKAMGDAAGLGRAVQEQRETKAERRALGMLRVCDRFLDLGLLGQATIRLHVAEAVTDLSLLTGLLRPSSPVLATICAAWLERVVRLATLRNEERATGHAAVLLTNQPRSAENGVYVVTSTNPVVLTRLPIRDVQFVGTARLVRRQNEERSA